MGKRRAKKTVPSFMEVFVDPLFGALGAFLFIFLMVCLMIGITGTTPTINTERLPDAVNGQFYEVWLAAQGGVGDYSWSAPNPGEIPAGLALTEDGYLSGTPAVEDLTDIELTNAFDLTVQALRVKADDPELTRTTRSYELVIRRDNPIEPSELMPVEILTESPLPDAVAGTEYRLALAAAGGLPPYTWASEVELPAGLTLDPGRGIIQGTAVAAEDGFRSTFTVTDARALGNPGREASVELELSVLAPPPPAPPPPEPVAILSETLPVAVETRPYEAGIAVRGGVPPYTWTANALPDWLRLDPETGVLTGTPPLDARGEAPVIIVVEDFRGTRARDMFATKLKVVPNTGVKLDPLKLLTKHLPRGFRGRKYEEPLAIRGGTPPYRVSATNLPGGLGVSGDGIVSGFPDTEGEFDIQFSIKDSGDPQQGDFSDVTLTIAPTGSDNATADTGDLVILTSSPLPKAMVGDAYALAFSATGGSGQYEWSCQGPLPQGLSFRNGRLSGTPTGTAAESGPFTVTVENARDSSSTASRQFVLTVSDKLAPVSLTSPKWLWLGAIFLIHMTVRLIWRVYCFSHIQHG